MVQSSPWCTAAVAVVCCFLSSEGVSYAWVWLFFTSNLIAVIKKSTSSDSQWVCVGWLERFDWMWNKQGLPQCTAKTIKWSLWGRPSRLWWLCAGHESGFCIWSLFSIFLSIYICLSVRLPIPLFLYAPVFLSLFYWSVSFLYLLDCLHICLSIYLQCLVPSLSLYLLLFLSFCLCVNVLVYCSVPPILPQLVWLSAAATINYISDE